jgi:hypothetical protein
MIFAISEIYCEMIGQDKTPEFRTLDYNGQSLKSKHSHAVSMIYCQGHCSHENGNTSAKSYVCSVI